MTPVVADGMATHTRHRLVRRLHAAGCTDVRIAEITAMTTYTAWRIRAALGLAPNPGKQAAWRSTP